MREIIVLLMYCCVSISVAAEIGTTRDFHQLPDDVFIHQQEAGVETQGWYKAVSLTRRFQVDFPAPYSEWSAGVVDMENEARIYSLGAVTKEGITFQVTEFPRFDEDNTSDIKSLTKAVFKGRATSYKRYFNYQQLDASEVKVRTASTVTIYRYILSMGYIYQISLAYPKKKARLAKKLESGFLTSFEVK